MLRQEMLTSADGEGEREVEGHDYWGLACSCPAAAAATASLTVTSSSIDTSPMTLAHPTVNDLGVAGVESVGAEPGSADETIRHVPFAILSDGSQNANVPCALALLS